MPSKAQDAEAEAVARKDKWRPVRDVNSVHFGGPETVECIRSSSAGGHWPASLSLSVEG